MQEYLQIPFMIILALLGLMSSKPVTHSPALRRGAPAAAGRRVISPR
jgi:hypothetical protein